MKLATLVYIQKNNKTLMVLRNKKENDMHKGLWNGLGGKFEPGETPEDCAIREIKEETNLNVKKMKLKGLVSFPMANGKEDSSWYVFVYVVTSFTGKLTTNSPEGDLKWIPNRDLLKLKMNESDYIFIPWFKKNKVFSAEFIFDEKGLKNYKVKFY